MVVIDRRDEKEYKKKKTTIQQGRRLAGHCWCSIIIRRQMFLSRNSVMSIAYVCKWQMPILLLKIDPHIITEFPILLLTLPIAIDNPVSVPVSFLLPGRDQVTMRSPSGFQTKKSAARATTAVFVAQGSEYLLLQQFIHTTFQNNNYNKLKGLFYFSLFCHLFVCSKQKKFFLCAWLKKD